MSQDKRESIVSTMAMMEGWDTRPYALAQQIREMIEPLADSGTSIDSGTSATEADLAIMVDGVPYNIVIYVAGSRTNDDNRN